MMNKFGQRLLKHAWKETLSSPIHFSMWRNVTEQHGQHHCENMLGVKEGKIQLITSKQEMNIKNLWQIWDHMVERKQEQTTNSSKRKSILNGSDIR